MLKTKDILDEKDNRLRKISSDVSFPVSESYRKAVDEMVEYLRNSQIDELAEKYDLRPGMGMAAPQLGINKRFFVVVVEKQVDDKQDFDTYVVFNPVITSHSEELIYASEGEGCLSVNREVEGIVPRYARVTLEGYDMDGNKVKYRGREEVSIAFQHELDHLNGILFVDRIDKKNPYKNIENMREI